MDFLCSCWRVNQSVLLNAAPGETPHHVPAEDCLIVHENITHLLFTSALFPPVHPGISKYKSALQTREVGMKFDTLHLGTPWSSSLKNVDLYYVVQGYYIS